MKPTISLCMIVRNEAHNVAECLSQVKGLVDEMIVVDTGSTDGTIEIASEEGAKVHSFTWVDDFSAARNEALKHASGDWIFWLDADDRLDPENLQRLASLLSGLGDEPEQVVYSMRCYSRLQNGVASGCWVTHTRLFRRDSGLQWRRRVHEQVLLDDLHLGVPVRHTSIVIEHRGYENSVQRRQKLNRDLRLLQLDFAINPDDPVTLFYLGWTQLELGNFAGALRFLRRGLERNHRARKAYTLLAQCLSQMGRAPEALEMCEKGLAEYPDDTELLYHHGRILGEAGDLAGAESYFRRLVDNPEPTAHYEVGVEAGLRGPKSRFMLGLIYDEQQRYDEAEKEYLWALAEDPTYAHAWLGLGQLYLNQRQWKKFSRVVAQLAGCPDGLHLAKVLRARGHILCGEFLAAHQLLDDAIAMDPQLLWPRLVKSDLLVAEGADWDQLIEAQQSILELDSTQKVAQARLDEYLRKKKNQPRQPSASPAGVATESGCSVVLAGW